MDFVAVILAAGEGSRAGGYKPLWELGEGRVVDRVVASASAVCSRVRVVGGAYFSDLEAHMVERWPGVELLENWGWREGGMFSSVRLGLDELDDAAFIHPCDIPGPGPAVYEQLAAAHRKHPVGVTRPAFDGRPGHPVLLSPVTVVAVLAASPASHLRAALAGAEKHDVPVDDDLVLRDFDTKDAFEALVERLSRS